MSKPKVKIGNFERRTTLHKVELRMEEGEEDSRKIRGYAAKFDSESELLGWDWVEVIDKGAFDGVLEDDVRCLKNHDPNLIVGRTKADTLTIGVDEIGLWYECDTVDNTAGNDLIADVRHGNIDQSSFGFDVEEAEWVKIETDDNFTKWVRHIKKVKKLYDVSPVTYPAYQNTEASVRSFNNFKEKNIGPPKNKKNKKETKSKKDKKAVRQRHLRLRELS